jgi:hypothetical protein
MNRIYRMIILHILFILLRPVQVVPNAMPRCTK